MARRYVEDRHEAKLSQRVIDVRPAGTIYAEWLSIRFNFLMVALPQVLLSFVAPLLAPLFLLSLLVHGAMHLSAKTVLPFRYPAGDPGSGARKSDKTDGILLLGLLESDSDYEQFKEIWESDDDLRKHMLIIGSTGSGKSETLKGIFFNSLCWSSGFFVADGKADNTLPAHTHTMVRSFGRDDDLLYLNFLLGGSTPEQVRKSRRRRTNKLNPVSAADADTIIQMGANMLPKVEGEGKNWQEKALNLWRAVIVALCYRRDTEGMDISVATIIEYLALPKVEELFLLGYEESLQRGEWSYGYAGVKAYLDSGCPAYKVDKLLAKNGYGDTPAPAGRPGAAASGKAFEQDSMAYEQHSYRTTQLMPVLNLLDKTYGYIFRDKYPEIDMIDVTLNNRILVMLIPSLEKSAQEAENLGKLAIACLRVMMGKNLGSEIEGTRQELLESKATKSPYPYMVALDELAYYFADGIAVMFAQARSLGFCMIAAAQDLEKLTEGSRAAEAGAMLANSVAKNFMRIDDAGKTYDFIKKILGQISVAVRQTYELGSSSYKKSKEIVVQDIDRVSLRELQEKGPGEGVFNSAGKTVRMKYLYIGKDLEQHANPEFWVPRFLQVEPPTPDEIDAFSIPIGAMEDKVQKGARMLGIMRHQVARSGELPPHNPVISAAAAVADRLNQYTPAAVRAVTLYQAAKAAVMALQGTPGELPAAATDVQRSGTGAPSESPASVGKRLDIGLPAETVNEGGPTHPQGPDEEDEGFDPLSFIDDPQPYQRKPAELLLTNSDVSVLKSESPGMGDSALPDEMNAVDRFFRDARSMNLRLAKEAPAQSKLVSPGTLLALAGDLSGAKAATSDSQSWIDEAIGDASVVLAARSREGKSVVGMSDDTIANVEQLEGVLGSPQPKVTAKRVEAVVSTRVTPNVTPSADMAIEDIAQFFDALDLDEK